MTKARTLADFISDGSPLADGTISVSEVSGAAPLANPTFTGTASGTFSGPLTGNVTGDVTGDVTGNITGNVTGNVTGDVAGEVDLSALAATISDTAVDVFVYDTSKDSDGGAWRKRTQGTSWYNETLNTATRGSRKEFPAVAVIVAESSAGELVIYDADDPDLPMWIKWTDVAMGGNKPITSVQMLNGILCYGTDDGAANSGGLYEVNFIKEVRYMFGWYSNTYRADNALTVSARTSDPSAVVDNSRGTILQQPVNDVAMTVLPNAPIDAATGLPVPTIAVATDGGYSIIKDDGTVVDGTCTQVSHQKVEKIGFTEDNMVFYGGFDYYLQDRSRLYRVDNILSSDTVLSTSNSDPQNSAELYGFTTNIAANDKTLVVDVAEGYTNDYLSDPHLAFSDSELRFANHNGLYKVARNKALPSAGLANKITSTYNTGWQNGAIKLATLSDTDDTDVTGSELVTNGTFDSDTSGWTAANSTLSASGGQLTVTSTANGAGYAYQAISVVSGKKYVATTDSISGTGVAGKTLYVGTSAGFGNLGGVQLPGDGSTVNFTFTASGTNTVYIFMYQDGNTASGDTTVVDNISVRLAEEDRSVNGNGLQVFGTVTKSAVATGADLVAYSGFSASNYLEQPYNSDLDFGTGDFCIMGWVKTGSSFSSTKCIVANGDLSNSNGGWMLGYNASQFKLWGAVSTSHSSNKIVSATTPATSTLYHISVQRTGSQMSLFINGILDATLTETSSMTYTNATLTVGVSDQKQYALDGGAFLALLRISATAPSPEQIARIYNDEKHLFTENAQATLYGSSDSVTALAFDDTTNLLHVGTSAGRSVFQGLRRVDNTTTAVTSAISASNGLVADE